MRNVGRPLAALFVLLASSGCELYELWYERELRQIQRELKRIPGVEVIDAGGNDDIDLEEIYVEVRVRSGTTIRFEYLTPEAFTGERSFAVTRFGDMVPRIVEFGYLGAVETATGKPAQSVGFGRNLSIGSEEALCCDSIRTARDFLRNVEAVEAELRSWPRCPQWSEHISPYGPIYRYCIASSADDPGPEIPPDWAG